MRINFFSNYFLASKNFLYSVIIIFPLIIIYELLHFIDLYKSDTTIINSFDVLSQVSSYLSFEYPTLYKSLFILVVYFIIIFIFRYKFGNNKVNIAYCLTMIIESFLYSIILYLFIINSPDITLIINNDVSNYIKISIGAGIWEELIFRLILINVLVYIFKLMLHSNISATLFAIFTSSVLFSFVHFIGPFGDEFIMSSFLYRWISGLYLGFLYVGRGYGITVYCHMFYDLFLFIYPTYNLGA